MKTEAKLVSTTQAKNDPEMRALGASLASAIKPPICIYLQGPLGAGKSTLVRGLIAAFGYEGIVKSPTFTLVEPYEIGDIGIYHFDLYRLSDPEELEYMGLRDYLTPQSILLLEWPDKGQGVIPDPDVLIDIEYEGESRNIKLWSHTAMGESLLQSLVQSTAS